MYSILKLNVVFLCLRGDNHNDDNTGMLFAHILSHSHKTVHLQKLLWWKGHMWMGFIDGQLLKILSPLQATMVHLHC